MEVLSEHQCQGWLEGYLLTGRHGLFNCYEAFIHIIDSMFNQHAKWLKVTREIPWRLPIASLNYLLSSHVWRQDHNGFSHQDPGFIDHVVNKKAEIIRVYLPPDANTLLSVADHCLRSRHYVNVIVAGKQPALNFLSMDEAIVHCTRGIGIWPWASNDAGDEPDVVLACAGDTPTLEALAAAAILRERLPELRVRVVNVVDLMRLAAGVGAPARDVRPRLRHPVHDRPAGRLRLPRLPVADPPAHVPAHEPPQPARARLQGGGHDHDALRHGDAERPRPLPPGHGRDRPRAGPRHARGRTCARRWSTPASATAPTRGSTATTRPRSATGRGRTDGVGAILVVNAGSTSLKLAPGRRAERRRERLESLDDVDPAALDAVAHRVVHGGERFRDAGARRRRRAGRDRAAASRSRRCTTPRRCASSTRPGGASPACRTWPCSTPRSTPRSRPRRRPTPCPAAGARSGGCAGTASTASRWRGRLRARARGGRPAAAGPAPGGLPPRRRQLGDGRRRRPLGRHHDGLQPARGRARWRRARARSIRARSCRCCAGRAWTPTPSTTR